jgi:hypothetical protein
MKKIGMVLFILLFFFPYISKSQNKWETGAFFAPSISKIDEQQFSKYNNPTFPVNYGIRINYNYKKFVFSSGIVHLTQGKKWIMRHVGNDPEGSEGTVPQKIMIYGWYIPINVNYNFLNRKKISLLSGLGLYTGYIYSQRYYYDLVTKDFNEIQYLDTLGFEFNASISLKYNLSEKFCFIITPDFLYQIRKKIPYVTDHIPPTPRLWSAMLEIGFYYKFGSNKEENENENPE